MNEGKSIFLFLEDLFKITQSMGIVLGICNITENCKWRLTRRSNNRHMRTDQKQKRACVHTRWRESSASTKIMKIDESKLSNTAVSCSPPVLLSRWSTQWFLVSVRVKSHWLDSNTYWNSCVWHTYFYLSVILLQRYANWWYTIQRTER